MTDDELGAIKERQRERMEIFDSQEDCPDTALTYLDDIAALLAEVMGARQLIRESLGFTRHRLGCRKFEHGDCDCGYQEFSNRACPNPNTASNKESSND